MSQSTVIGSAVNLASRLEHIAENNQILITQTTKSRVESRFAATPIHVKGLKSYSGVTECFEVGRPF